MIIKIRDIGFYVLFVVHLNEYQIKQFYCFSSAFRHLHVIL